MELYPVLPGESIELRTIDPTNPRRVRSLFCGSWDELYEKAPEYEVDNDVYFGVCPRTPDENGVLAGAARNVRRCPVVWVDLDPRGGQFTKQDRLVQLESAPPNFIVDSGRGYHAYWRLNEDLHPRAAQHVMREMAAHFRCDDTGDPPRILRVPNTLNHKGADGHPYLVSLIHASENGFWNPENLPREELPLDEWNTSSGHGRFTQRIQLIEEHGVAEHGSTIEGEDLPGRDRAMYDVAFFYHCQHWDRDKILAHLLDINEKNRPPLSEVELRKKVSSACKNEPPPNIIEVEEVPIVLVSPAVIPVTQFTVQSMADIMRFEEPPTEWMAEGVLARGHIVYTMNPPKSGKTSIALNLGLRMAAGRSGAGLFIERPYRVLFLQPMGDMHPSLTREWMKKIGVSLKLDPDISFELATLGERQDHFKYLQERAKDYDLVIVDTISRLFPAVDAVETHIVSTELDKIRRLRMAYPDTCWLYLVQVGKNSLSHMRGATPGFAARGNSAIAEVFDDSLQIITPTGDIERHEVLGLNLTRHLVMMGRGAAQYRRPWRTRFDPETYVIDWVQDLTYDEATEETASGGSSSPTQTTQAADLLGQLFLDAKEAEGKRAVLASAVYQIGEENGFSKRVMKLALGVRGGTIDPPRGPKAMWWDSDIEVVE